jgi:transglutaminase-like putative cysteine protease
MILIILFNWLRKNLSLVLLLTATVALSLALTQLIRGDTWSLFIPVTCAASLCGWELGRSHLSARKAGLSLIVLGIPAVFIYVGGLIAPLGILFFSVFSLIPQIILWLYKKTLVDFTFFFNSLSNISNRTAVILSRVWEWSIQVSAGKIVFDPVAIGVIWSILLWLVCAWSGWQLRRNHNVLSAFVPSGLVLALVLDYTQKEIWLAVLYLAVILLLIGVTNDNEMHLQWQQHSLDYAESISVDTFVTVIAVTILLVSASALMPSISWKELVNKIREEQHGNHNQMAESLGLQPPPPPTPTQYQNYPAAVMPRSFLIGTPPQQLQDVVMTVSVNELPYASTIAELKPNRYYWRMVTYDLYTGSGWTSSSTKDISLPASTLLMKQPIGYRAIRQKINLVPDQSPQLYWAGLLAQSDENLQIAWRAIPPLNPDPINDGDILGVSTNRRDYNVVSYLPQFTATQLRASGTEYPSEITKQYLSLPDSVPERVIALARNLTEAAPTPYDRAMALQTYLRKFPYTLDIQSPPLGRDVVDYFLFDLQKGYCDYYASAMVVMARAAGLPSRMVVGYVSGEYNAPTAEYIVREKDAHSWVEIYFEGIGWVEFEPTASEAPIIRTGDTENPQPSVAQLPHPSTYDQLITEWQLMISNFGGQAILVFASLLILIMLWQTGEIWILYFLPSDVVVTYIYNRLEKLSLGLIPDLIPMHTPHELQAALSDKLQANKNSLVKAIVKSATDEIKQLVTLYEIQIYSQHRSTQLQVRSGIRTWSSLRWKLRIAMSLVTFNPFHQHPN